MKLAITTALLAALIAGSALVSQPRSRRAVRRLPQLVAATARLVATAVAPPNDASLLAAAQDFVAAQMRQRHRIVTTPALSGDQLPVDMYRLTRWR